MLRMLRVRTIVRPCSLFMAAALTLASPAAFALDPKPVTIRSELKEDAREAWDRAQALMRAKDYGAALVQFNRAYDLSKNPRVLFNVGICEKELHHYARAATRFEQELAEGEAQLTADEKAELKNAVDIVRRYVSTVAVSSNEPEATLYVDDYEIGKTPFMKPILVDVGPRKMTLKKDGYTPQTLNLDVVAGQPGKADFTIEEAVKKGLVHITVNGAPNAIVWMDGTEMGPAPFHGKVLAGLHTFEARAIGFATATQTSTVAYHQEHNIVMTMSLERHSSRVAVDALPAGAMIEIDGKVVGSTHWEGNLPTGGHQLIVKKPGYQVFSQELALQDDQVRNVRATLIEERSSTWVWWTAGTLAVIGAGAVVSYFVFRPSDPQPYIGTLPPGTQTAGFHWR